MRRHAHVRQNRSQTGAPSALPRLDAHVKKNDQPHGNGGTRTPDIGAAARQAGRVQTCGAGTRAGGVCRQLSMKNGRCRFHGGLSTGPRTAAGLERSRKARWKHGRRSADANQPLKLIRALVKVMEAELAEWKSLASSPAYQIALEEAWRRALAAP